MHGNVVMKKPRKKDLQALELSREVYLESPEQIINKAIALFKPVKIFVGFSGGYDSTVATGYSMDNVPGCEVVHIDTGIGIKLTRDHVRQTCKDNKWPLRIVRAKEDCGQDYDELVKKFGFPGPSHHSLMFRCLKERACEKLLRDNKTSRNDNVMLITGIRQDESQRRSNYQDKVVSFKGNLLWVSPFYYKDKSWFESYIKRNFLKRNPVSEVLGMSGECLCGAFAHKGEKELIKLVCSETHARIEALEIEVKNAGHNWGWEESPPKKRADDRTEEMFPMCVGCGK